MTAFLKFKAFLLTIGISKAGDRFFQISTVRLVKLAWRVLGVLPSKQKTL
ncbi:hypothetical protein AVDCRST_MAG94-4675 [uncultured Leptolyngbya sp.]|uniref:Uncharacterized protein n=1 Tax=uncultured Leptolyngbya sp. TaxID=332963 RepID=A0A6J4N4S9_9CYAN|nr:hypothetical protein AVDCRST_MAG94-4675 [uncultured Leptolyngbya sp.]